MKLPSTEILGVRAPLTGGTAGISYERYLSCMERLGSAMKGELRIGTSGWIYPHWRGDYYPSDLPQRDWFGHYSRDFDTVEINNTFYRLPEAKTFVHWGEVAPEGFLYTFKANRYITHLKRLKDPESSLEKFIDRIAGAGPSLGPLLYQLPPRFPADSERLELFLKALPRERTHVFEFRDSSWHSTEIRDLLERYGAAFCIHDHGQSGGSPEWVTAQTVYLRYHGSSEDPYSGSYSDALLCRQAEKIAVWRSGGKRVFAYFNNDIGGHAVHNAFTLKELCGKCSP
jgi:uncharacterized protein YecE (DUF72 family)